MTATATRSHTLSTHPDRLLPGDAAQRAVARELYDGVAGLPIISPHGHVPPTWLSDDIPFTDPTTLLISPDHYVTRLLHAQGVDLADLGVGAESLDEASARRAFRLLCENWQAFRGTPVRYWMIDELVGIFGVDVRPSVETADAIYDTIAEKLSRPEFRPRALFERFGIEFLATTDDPCDDLAPHARLAADPTFTGRVAPTFRPDPYLEPARADWVDRVGRLGEVSGIDTGTAAGFAAAMEQRRRYFV